MDELLPFFLVLTGMVLSAGIFVRIMDSLFDVWRQRLRIKTIKLEIDLASKDPQWFREVKEELHDIQNHLEGDGEVRH